MKAKKHWVGRFFYSLLFTPYPLRSLFLAAFIFLIPFSSTAEVTDRILAIVNDDIITLKEVEKYVAVERKSRYSSMNEYMRNLELRDKLDVFIESLLINQQARKLKIEVVDKEVDGTIANIKKQNLISDTEFREQLKKENITYNDFVAGVKRSLVRQKVLARAVSQETRIDEKVLRDYYTTHVNEFAEEEYKLQHIFISGQRKDAAARAQAAAARLHKDVPFEEVAKEYSDEPSRSEGGNIGYVKNADLIPQLKEGVKLLLPGSYTNVIPTPYGFHIMKLVEAKKDNAPPFEEVKDRVQEKLFQNEAQKRYNDYIAKLKSSSYIEVKI